MLNRKLAFILTIVFTSFFAFSQEKAQIDNHVVTTTYTNGQLKTLSTMADTIKNGVQLKLDKYGRLEMQAQYLLGELDGKQLTFERGRVSVIKNYSKGLLEGLVETYSSSRKISSSENYSKGVKSGESKWFYYSGKLCSVYNYEKGSIVGESKFFFENGKVQTIYNFKNSEIDGEYTEFDINGNKILEGQYTNGRKEGKWKFYDEKGKLIKTEKFKKGEKK